MSKLPVVSGKQICKILAKMGYLANHQTGSHIILRHENHPHRRLTVPDHKEIAKGTFEGCYTPGRINSGRIQRIVMSKE